MTVSFYINKNDIQEVNNLVDNFDKGPFNRDEFIIVECFSTTDEIRIRLGTANIPNRNFIQVNIEYSIFDKIKEYLKF